MIQRVHHIDFVVRDLDRAVERYSKLFGRPPGARESLPERGVELVRFDLGNVWVILVQPIRSDSPVADFLVRHGEGFFHIGYQVDDVMAEAERLREEEIGLVNPMPRTGVEGWKLIDIAPDEAAGVWSQLVQVNAD